jgi:3-oxoacyl-[acyl-carrier protein] reductase
MNLDLQGRVAVVCGASKGLGRACAEALAAEGVRLVVCSRTFDDIFKTARSISETYGVDAVPFAGDLSQPDIPEKVVAEAVKKYGTVDILVNNAGGPPPGGFETISDDDWAMAFQLTLMSAVRMCRAVLPVMKARRWGRIINLASISVKQPIPNLILSNALRSAVTGMAKTLSQETGPYGVLVNTIATGNFDTERLRQIIRNRARVNGTTEEEAREVIEESVPLGRIGEPAELAAFVAFLASERASYVTGATIQIDGGMYTGLV